MEESLAKRFTIDMDDVQEVRRRFPAHLHDWAERVIAADPNAALDEGVVDLVHQFCLQPLWQGGKRQDLIDKAAARANGKVVMAMTMQLEIMVLGSGASPSPGVASGASPGAA